MNTYENIAAYSRRERKAIQERLERLPVDRRVERQARTAKRARLQTIADREFTSLIREEYGL